MIDYDLNYLRFLQWVNANQLAKETLNTNSRVWKYTNCRKTLAYILTTYCNITHVDIARFLNLERSSVSTAIKKHKLLMTNYRKYIIFANKLINEYLDFETCTITVRKEQNNG